MPNSDKILGAYIARRNPDTMNESSLYAAGQLGQTFEYKDRTYQIVRVDSGCVAANGVGVPAANDLLWWKDKSNYIVTNDWRQAFTEQGGGTAPTNNAVAGILRNAATAGYYICMLVRGRNIAVADDGSVGKGELVIASATASQAQASGIAAGTAATHKIIGVGRTASSSNVAYVDVDIPEIP